MLTHQAHQGGYNYYSDSDDSYGNGLYGDSRGGGSGDPYGDFDDDPYGDADGYGRDDHGSHDDPLFGDEDRSRRGRFGRGGPRDDDPDEEMSAAALKKRKWRRIRRVGYVATALMFLVPLAMFVVGYLIWDVQDPAQVAKRTDQTIVVKYSDNTEMTRIVPDGGNRTMIEGVDEVAKPMRDATLAAEDASFYANPGFDVMGIVRAVWAQVTNSPGGGSTLTQQYIKLSTGNDAPTYTRKFKEIVLAFKMSNEQPKDDILKAYLNTAYYGRGAYGIHAAADAYFGKLPKQLNPSESAVLAGMVQRPTGNDPRVDAEQGAQRWEYVADQMAANKFVTQQERSAMQLPETRGRFEWRGEEITGPQYHIRERILAELDKEGYTESSLARSGFTIVTTIDPAAQRAAEESVEKVTGSEPKNLRTSLVAVDPTSGGVRAYYGGGREVGGFDYASAPQEPGSSFKPFVALAGLEQGLGIGRNYDGSAPQEILGETFNNSEGVECDVPTQCGVREAMTKSVNTVFVNILKETGAKAVRDAAIQAGIPAEYDGQPSLQNADGGVDAGISLGAYPVRTIDMASAYGTFANDGMRTEPRFVDKLVQADGEVHKTFGNRPEPAFSEDPEESKNLAANVTETLLDVVKEASLSLTDGRPVAAKTGTHQFFDTKDNAKAWMVGYTPQLSAAVSIGADDETGVKPVMDSSGSPIYGSGLPGEVWQEFMSTYHQGKPVEQFTKAEPIGEYKMQAPTFDTPPPTSAPPPSSEAPPPPSEMPSESAPPSETESEEPSTEPEEPCGGIFQPPCPDEGDGDGDSGGSPGNGVRPTREPEGP